jgi:hypothetical protein
MAAVAGAVRRRRRNRRATVDATVRAASIAAPAPGGNIARTNGLRVIASSARNVRAAASARDDPRAVAVMAAGAPAPGSMRTVASPAHDPSGMRRADHLMVLFIVSPHAERTGRIFHTTVGARDDRMKNPRARTTPYDARWLPHHSEFRRTPHCKVFAVAAAAAQRFDGSLPSFARVVAHVSDARGIYRWQWSTSTRIRAKLRHGRARPQFERAS